MLGKILVLQGNVASGKTSFAKTLVTKDTSYIRVNRDDIRNMFRTVWQMKDEELVKEVEKSIVKKAIHYDYNIVIDDVNLNPETCDMWKGLAKELGCAIEFKFIQCPLKECIRRDALRTPSVGEKVIMNLYSKYLKMKL